MDKYDRVYQAAKVLELSETATLKDIKACYHRLAKKWHPDTCTEDPEQCEQKTREILEAYECLLDYCTTYRFSFRREDLRKSSQSE